MRKFTRFAPPSCVPWVRRRRKPKDETGDIQSPHEAVPILSRDRSVEPKLLGHRDARREDVAGVRAASSARHQFVPFPSLAPNSPVKFGPARSRIVPRRQSNCPCRATPGAHPGPRILECSVAHRRLPAVRSFRSLRCSTPRPDNWGVSSKHRRDWKERKEGKSGCARTAYLLTAHAFPAEAVRVLPSPLPFHALRVGCGPAVLG